jgi:hypothetical protein
MLPPVLSQSPQCTTSVPSSSSTVDPSADVVRGICEIVLDFDSVVTNLVFEIFGGWFYRCFLSTSPSNLLLCLICYFGCLHVVP